MAEIMVEMNRTFDLRNNTECQDMFGVHQTKSELRSKQKIACERSRQFVADEFPIMTFGKLMTLSSFYVTLQAPQCFNFTEKKKDMDLQNYSTRQQ